MMVPVGGLEPPRIAATDFESVVYTNFTTPAEFVILSLSLLSGWNYTRITQLSNNFYS